MSEFKQEGKNDGFSAVFIKETLLAILLMETWIYTAETPYIKYNTLSSSRNERGEKETT